MSDARLLEHLLLHSELPDWYSPEPIPSAASHAIGRLAAAIEAGIQGMDWAVLVRQCIRRLSPHEVVRLPRLEIEAEQRLERVDVHQDLDGTLRAVPYQPDWIYGLGEVALDCPPERRQVVLESSDAEPWLRRLVGKTRWKSPAQKDATWAALNAPTNSTLLVGLPTGSGKSLVYQCCAAFSSGLTVLVVPTVALGLDQLAALSDFASKSQLKPAFYTSDDQAQSVLAEVEARRCRLLITSPEAIVNGKLRAVLERHAIEGHLQQLVIDEAHLIESWGADFRVEFQLLGAMLRHWRKLSPSGVRTLLLSATFSPQAPDALKGLFAHEGGLWEERVIQRLRPEIHYFTAATWSTIDEQKTRVIEALHRLPRPAILYVTKKDKAVEFGNLLSDQGFKRFRVFHGDTLGPKRQEILDEWRQDRIDLVIATSAFGMGVDKPDVKAVVHACLPEGIDRFYQEVGRGGRDGTATISLLVPGGQDNRVAESMGPTLLADPVKIQGRWDAMWRKRDSNGENWYRIPTAEAATHLITTETFDESVRWNKRLLLLMERAKLLEIVGLESRYSEDKASYTEYANIRLKSESLNLEHDLPSLLQETRTEETKAVAQSLGRLSDYFKRSHPICRELRNHYGELTQRSCGSCSFCRLHQCEPRPARELQFPVESRHARPLVQLVEAPAINSQAFDSKMPLIIRKLLKSGLIRRFIAPTQHRSMIDHLFSRAENAITGPYRIDALEDADSLVIGTDEKVVVFHVHSAALEAASINHHGILVAHWQLGGAIENQPGRWPFMYDFSARPYSGPEALDRWIDDLERQSTSKQ